MEKSISNKTALLLALSVILILCIPYYFGFRDIKDKNEHYSTLKRDYSYEVEKQTQINLLQKNIQNSDSDISLVNNSIIPTDGDVKFIEDIESIAHKNGLEIAIDTISLEDSPSLHTSNLTFLKVKAKIKGSWEGVYSFLSEMELLPYKIKVDNAGLISGSDDSGASKKTPPKKVWQGVYEIRVLKGADVPKNNTQ